MSNEEITKSYSNNEITVEWRSEKCTHSANCVRGLKAVFDNQRKPWIVLENATSQEIIDQVHKCPSGALRVIKK